PSKYEDPQGALSKLLQLATVEKYQARVAGTLAGLEANKVVGGDDLESSDGKQYEAKVVKLVVVAVEQNIDKPNVKGLSCPPCLVYTITSPASSSSSYLPESSNKESIATSMIVLGSYEDDEDAGDVIVYTTNSRQDKHSRKLVHQKHEGGNLAMEISMHYGIKVRVIQGFKYEGSASGTVYVYDRLYKIVEAQFDVGKLGFGVFKFKLVRMENQVEMGSAVLKFTIHLELDL
nr:histone-lysine N-methyltransferase family member SUVH9-like [Tanacetum cinerariifolium]